MKRSLTVTLCLCALLIAGCACYYFVIALPRNATARLEFERQKYAAQLQARQAEEKDETPTGCKGNWPTSIATIRPKKSASRLSS
jgi:hypothetical protein